jgi:hypothetical protein
MEGNERKEKREKTKTKGRGEQPLMKGRTTP